MFQTDHGGPKDVRTVLTLELHTSCPVPARLSCVSGAPWISIAQKGAVVYSESEPLPPPNRFALDLPLGVASSMNPPLTLKGLAVRTRLAGFGRRGGRAPWETLQVTDSRPTEQR